MASGRVPTTMAIRNAFMNAPFLDLAPPPQDNRRGLACGGPRRVPPSRGPPRPFSLSRSTASRRDAMLWTWKERMDVEVHDLEELVEAHHKRGRACCPGAAAQGREMGRS